MSRIARMSLNAMVIGNNELLSPAPNRVCLMFSSASSTAYSLWTQPLTALGLGLLIPSQSRPVTVRVEDFGSLVTGSWYVYSNSNFNLTVVEVLDG